jgi:hypothetical protein
MHVPPKAINLPPHTEECFRNFTNMHRGFTMDHRQEAADRLESSDSERGRECKPLKKIISRHYPAFAMREEITARFAWANRKVRQTSVNQLDLEYLLPSLIFMGL